MYDPYYDKLSTLKCIDFGPEMNMRIDSYYNNYKMNRDYLLNRDMYLYKDHLYSGIDNISSRNNFYKNTDIDDIMSDREDFDKVLKYQEFMDKSIITDAVANIQVQDTSDKSSENVVYVYKGELPSTQKEDVQQPDNKELLKDKSDLKHKAKSLVRHNFKMKIGNFYYLRNKLSKTSKEFQLKKIIYTINNEIVNITIMKQISGINNNIFTLNKEDCKKLHIKYEPGLQVFDINLNWVPKNKNYR